LWRSVCMLGQQASEEGIAAYEEIYKRFKKSRDRLIAKGGIDLQAARMRRILDHDDAEVDPATASVCWIECGNVTAMGRELEFKAEQGLYFGLDHRNETERIMSFVVSDGSYILLRMKYQENHMWRLQMNNNVPEVAHGLRPVLANGSLGRSSMVAVFERLPERLPELDAYKLSFTQENGRKHKELRRNSLSYGTCGKTTAREYGWY
jgi:hypothetical protein